ncbi:MAG TPA: hypothetical protein VMN36_11070 [Verrucomicrobiales bacterium]|nr:hypothetical protein [Verrucomicrobiales bacterium]
MSSCALLPGPVLGVAGQEDSAAVKNGLTAEEDRAFEEFIEKGAELRREAVEKKVGEAIADVIGDLDLDEPSQEALRSLEPQVVEGAQSVWRQRFREWLTPYLQQSGNALGMLKEWNPVDLSANATEVSVRIQLTEAWKEGLARILTSEEAAQHAEKEAQRLASIQEELTEYLDACDASAFDAMLPMMDSDLGEIRQIVGLDEERRQKLEKLAEEAVRATVRRWRERKEQRLLEMEDEQREMMISRGGMMGVDTSHVDGQPQQSPAWQAALADVLTEDERALIAARRSENRSRRSEALALVLIDFVDRFIGLSEQQRLDLLEAVNEPMLRLPDHYYRSAGRGYFSLDPGQMFQQLSEVDEKILRAIMDESQMKRWNVLTPQVLARHSHIPSTAGALEGIDVPSPEDMDAGAADRLVSVYLHRRSKEMRRKHQVMMEAKAARVARAASLAPEAVRALNTAAKGSAEELARQNIQNLEHWARQQFQAVAPKDVPTKLKSLNGPYYSDQHHREDPQLWQTTLTRVLSETEREAWETEEGAAKAWQRRSQTAVVMTEVDKHVALEAEARQRLENRVAELIQEYETDFSNMFSFAWHCEGYYAAMPLGMMTEQEWGTFFDPKQMEILHGRGLAEIQQMADNIRQNRQQRTKE